jgi:pimeloyl-ACP methyl ester carboxylesterase
MRLAASLLLAALVLGGTAFAVDRRATTREADATATWPPEGTLVQVGGRTVHAVTRGQGPDLILIHGASGNLRDFTLSFMDRLTDRYRVTAFDRPGLGHTDRVDDGFAHPFARFGESPADQAALLAAAADALGLENPVILGHSYGASVAMAWALDRPGDVAGVVNVSGATMPWPGGLGFLYKVNGTGLGGALVPPLLAAFTPEPYVDRVIEEIFTPDLAPDGYAEAVGAGLTIRRDTLRANARQVNSLYPHVVAMSARYPGLNVPVEIVHGDADTIVPLDIHSEPLARLLPDATLTVLPGIGHMPHHAAPDAVVAAIDRVFARAALR